MTSLAGTTPLTASVEVIDTPNLGDRSYVVHLDGSAVVVDPQRDIDRVEAIVARLGLTVTHVLETHIHNDYVSGGLELARGTGAEYVLPHAATSSPSRRSSSPTATRSSAAG